MAKKLYTKSDLSKAASQAKREIINKFKKGTISKITKSDALDIISKKLKLKSARTLWTGDSHTYLDEWFSKLDIEVKELLKTDEVQQVSSPTSPSVNEQDKNDLKEKNILISEYEKAIKVLREENEKLRLLIIDKYGKIDL